MAHLAVEEILTWGPLISRYGRRNLENYGQSGSRVSTLLSVKSDFDECYLGTIIHWIIISKKHWSKSAGNLSTYVEM